LGINTGWNTEVDLIADCGIGFAGFAFGNPPFLKKLDS
jgi:hypothetical protein